MHQTWINKCEGDSKLQFCEAVWAISAGVRRLVWPWSK